MTTATHHHEYQNKTTDASTSKSPQSHHSAAHNVDTVIAPLVPKQRTIIVEKFDQETDETQDKGCCLAFDNTCCSILGRWWYVRYQCQRRIVGLVEKPAFHIAIIVLVLIDCLLVIAELMLDFMKLKEPCGPKSTSLTAPHHEEDDHKLELAIEILHYSSLTLLAVFLVEVVVKVHAFGRQWWDFHEKKMEWLDAIIVIVSFIIDLSIMHTSNVLAEISLLFISLRLWRFIRIINSVAQSIRSEAETKKKHLATTYLQVIELLLTISEKKTNVTSELRLEMTSENFENVLEHFGEIDQSCRTSLEHCPHPSSLNAVTDIAHHLQDDLEKVRLTLSTMSPSFRKSIDNRYYAVNNLYFELTMV